MKKFKLMLATLLAFVVGVFCFAACSKSEADFAGTYKFESMKYETEGVSVDLKAGMEFMGMTLTEDFCVIVLNEGGTATATMMGEDTVNGTWKIEENDKISIEIDGEAKTVDCDGTTITMEEEGAKITLKKI